MELYPLQVFLAIATERSFSRAAEKLGRTQPAVSLALQRLELALARAGETSQRLEQHSAQLENAQQQALAGFQSQLENALSPHREEMQRRSEAIFEEINARIRTTFEEASRQAVAQFDRQVAEMVQPHVSRAEEAVHRLPIAPAAAAWYPSVRTSRGMS